MALDGMQLPSTSQLGALSLHVLIKQINYLPTREGDEASAGSSSGSALHPRSPGASLTPSWGALNIPESPTHH